MAMPDLVRTVSPEDREVERKRQELATLEAEFADAELALLTCHAELAAFEALFVERVGSIYAESDAIRAAIARLRARMKPGDAAAAADAERARQTADESAAASNATGDFNGRRSGWEASPELREIWRRAARRMHPDLAGNDDERIRRTSAMARVNAAYEAGDFDELSRLLREWEQCPEAVEGTDAGAELIRLIRRISFLRDRIELARVELVKLRESDLAVLKAQVDEAASAGRSLLDEMRATAQSELEAARTELRRVEAQATA